MMGMVATLRMSGIIAGTGLILLGCGDTAAKGAAVPGDSAATKAADSAATTPAVGTNRTIVFLGTSLTAGYGIDPESSYPARVQHIIDSLKLPYTVMNAGESGETSANAVRRLDWVMRSRPAVLVLETGANDGLRGQDVDTLQANMQAIINRIRAKSPDTRIVLAGMEALPNLGAEYTRRFRAVYPAVAKANNLPLIPFLLAGVAGIDSLNQQDGIHPNERGADIVARTVWAVLGPILR
jgi:acyl-CoA thioesterase-1